MTNLLWNLRTLFTPLLIILNPILTYLVLPSPLICYFAFFIWLVFLLLVSKAIILNHPSVLVLMYFHLL